MVCPAEFRRIHRQPGTPGERLATQPAHQVVRGDSAEAAVAVRERVNPHESVVEPDGESTARRILWCALALIPVSLLPRFWSMAGNLYVVGATVAGIGFLYYCWRVMQDRTRVRARGVLLASVVYLPILYGLLVIDHTGL